MSKSTKSESLTDSDFKELKKILKRQRGATKLHLATGIKMSVISKLKRRGMAGLETIAKVKEYILNDSATKK